MDDEVVQRGWRQWGKDGRDSRVVEQSVNCVPCPVSCRERRSRGRKFATLSVRACVYLRDRQTVSCHLHIVSGFYPLRPPLRQAACVPQPD